MKKLLILTTFLSLVIMTSVAHAEWTKVDENYDGDVFYVDFERIRKHNGKVYFWHLSDYTKPVPPNIFSMKWYFEAECGRFAYRALSISHFSSQMGEGTHLNADKELGKTNWRYPQPHSNAEVMLKAVCNHKTMQ